MTDKACAKCAYDMGPAWDDCTFPEPQDESPPPFMVCAAMPDRRDGGRNCIQFQRAKDKPHD